MLRSQIDRPLAPGTILGFMQRLWALDHALQVRSKHMRARFGITGPQRLVIRLIGRCPGVSAGEIAATLQVHPSTLTGVFRRLEHQRMIRRTADTQDHRRAAFHLTERGRRINSRHAGTVEGALRPAIARIPRSKFNAAQEVLAELAAALSQPSPDSRWQHRRTGAQGGTPHDSR